MDDTPTDPANKQTWGKLSPLATGLYGKCPRCGRGHIFQGFLKVRDHCEVCGLNFDFADPADGPAVFVQLFASVPGVVFLLVLEIVANPPNWVLLLAGLPVVVITTVLPLRPIKGWLIAAQYSYDAQQAGTQQQWDQLNAAESLSPKSPEGDFVTPAAPGSAAADGTFETDFGDRRQAPQTRRAP